jgi:hypothetical protein
MDRAPGVDRPLLQDRPAPLTFFDDYLDFYDHDYHHKRQEVVSCEHSDLRVLSRRGNPAGFFILTAMYEQSASSLFSMGRNVPFHFLSRVSWFG